MARQPIHSDHPNLSAARDCYASPTAPAIRIEADAANCSEASSSWFVNSGELQIVLAGFRLALVQNDNAVHEIDREEDRAVRGYRLAAGFAQRSRNRLRCRSRMDGGTHLEAIFERISVVISPRIATTTSISTRVKPACCADQAAMSLRLSIANEERSHDSATINPITMVTAGTSSETNPFRRMMYLLIMNVRGAERHVGEPSGFFTQLDQMNGLRAERIHLRRAMPQAVRPPGLAKRPSRRFLPP